MLRRIGTHVRQERQAAAILEQRRQIRFLAEATLAVASVGEYLTVWINNDRASIIVELWIASDAVYSHDVGLVLNRARLQQPLPMMDASRLPVGDDHEELRLMR